MRIVAGTAKGRTIKAPTGYQVRPTTGRVREAIFSSLGHRVKGATVLDLFAGSGALGLEALSRGAASAFLVEKSRRVLDVLFSNIDVLDMTEQCHIIRGDAIRALGALKAKGESFDLIFLDPPYETDLLNRAIKLILAERLLTQNGRIIAEHKRKKEYAFHGIEGLQIVTTKVYGDTQISMLDIVDAQVISTQQEE